MLLRKILAGIATVTVATLLAPTAARAAVPAADPATPSRTVGAAASANPVIVVGGLIGISIAYEPIAARLRADGYRVRIHQLVRPVDNAMLADGATNVLVQGWCPLRVVGHVGLVLDGTTYTVVRQALAGAAIRPDCFAI
ncbi:hypothetical protein ABZ570_04725 [Micromonospora sp. NPDC007271]|uniref:hypothetical protein n=1 Tax=Micromonospora sp. NPDC007271 TaxID=3154587 RepID=UPI0033C394C8